MINATFYSNYSIHEVLQINNIYLPIHLTSLEVQEIQGIDDEPAITGHF
jgi:hypothetical protein